MEKNIIRSRLGEKTEEKVLRFLSSLEDDKEIFEEDIIGTEIHDIMLYATEIITFPELVQILRGLEEILANKEAFLEKITDSDCEDIHPLIETAVITKIGMDIGGKLHSGRSRNDQVNLDMRLKCRGLILECLSGLLILSKNLLRLADQHKNTIAPLYTHLQPAQIGVLAHYFLNYTSQMNRNIDRLIHAYSVINQNPLGACAVGGTSFPIDRVLTTKLLAFDCIIENSLDAVSSRDAFLEVMAFLTLLASDFSRIAEDLILFSTAEFGFIELADDFTSVSSVMPQKKNPDTMEIIKGQAGKLFGQYFQVLTILKGAPSGYIRDFQEIKPPLFGSLRAISSQIEILIGVFSSLDVLPENLEHSLEIGKLNALDVAEFLVQEYGLSFRESHICIGTLIKEHSRAPLKETLSKERIEKKVQELTNREITIASKQLDAFFSYAYCLERRVSRGSPNPNQIKSQIELFQRKLQEKELQVSQLRDRLENSMNKIQDLVRLALKDDKDGFDEILSSFST